MENISNVALGNIIWIPPQFRELSESAHDITQKVLAIWHFMHTQEKWEFNSPLILLRETNYFPPVKGILFGEWIEKENAQLKDIMERGKNDTLQN